MVCIFVFQNNSVFSLYSNYNDINKEMSQAYNSSMVSTTVSGVLRGNLINLRGKKLTLMTSEGGGYTIGNDGIKI